MNIKDYLLAFDNDGVINICPFCELHMNENEMHLAVFKQNEFQGCVSMDKELYKQSRTSEPLEITFAEYIPV